MAVIARWISHCPCPIVAQKRNETNALGLDMREDYLTEEILRKALELDEPHFPLEPVPYVCYPGEWENIQKTFNLTNEQMEKLFIKSTYIELDGGT